MTFLPPFDASNFEPGQALTNDYFPISLGDILSYEAREDGELIENNQVLGTFQTKEITGVQSVVVRDIAWDEGVLVEDTHDWYAQDKAGNIWYMGEIATNYEYDDDGNFLGTNNEGSWEAGIDGALPGYLIQSNPQVGDNYFQEFRPGIAVDEAIVVDTNATVEIGLGTFDNVLKTRDFTVLAPDVYEFKYYAPGIGQILAEEDIPTGGNEPDIAPELVKNSTLSQSTLPTLFEADFSSSTQIDNPYFSLMPGSLSIYETEDVDDGELGQELVLVTDQTQEILGITARVVKEIELEEGQIEETSEAYYAQDAAGNVWLLGESNTEYGENGQPMETEGWLAGQDQFLPGYAMVAAPEVGSSYYQQFEMVEADEQARVISQSESIETDYGRFTNVLRIEEFSDLDPDGTDLNDFVTGVGLVQEKAFDDDGELESVTQLVQHLDLGGAPTNLSLGQLAEAYTSEGFQAGTDAANTLFGSAAGDFMVGGDGDDLLFGNDGADWLLGGAGADQLFGGAEAQTLSGGEGNDTLFGNGGADLLVGGAGDDVIYGSGDADTIRGGAGNDRIFSNGGADVIDAGSGLDEIWLGSGAATVTLSAGEGHATLYNFQLGQTQLELGSGASVRDGAQGAELMVGRDLVGVVAGQTAAALSAAQPQLALM